MFLLTSNKARRLLHLTFVGHVTAAEIEQGGRDLVALLPDLPADLRLLADLERLESMDTDCAELLGKNMEVLDRHGVELAVRVISDQTKDIGFNILAVFHYRNPPRTVVCETMIEAARVLAL